MNITTTESKFLIMIHSDSRKNTESAHRQQGESPSRPPESDTKDLRKSTPGGAGRQLQQSDERRSGPRRSGLDELNLREVRIPLPDVPRLTAEQAAYLRSWGDSIVDMLASLSRKRDTFDHTMADRELERQIKYLVLTEARAAQGERLGIGIDPLWNSVVDFFEAYFEERRETYFPMSQELRGILVSTIAACYDPMLPLAAARVLEHVSSTATDSYANVGALLSWRYLLARPGILVHNPTEKKQPPDGMFAEKVNRLVVMPLTNPGTHIRNARALRRVVDLANADLSRAGREVSRDEGVLHFSRIFIEGVKGQPFMEGNHRTAWILANSWLLQARGEYIPYSNDIEKESIETEVASMKWDWRVCGLLGIAPSALKRFARVVSTCVTPVEKDM